MPIKSTLAHVRRFIRDCLPDIWVAKLMSLRAGKCRQGRDVYIAPGVQLIGATNISIGDNSCISEQTWMNVNHRSEREISIAIGQNCFIGRRNFFSSGKKIEVGHYVLTTIDCKFICSSHIVDNPLLPYLCTGTTKRDSIYVGVNCFFGAGSMVIGNVNIGHGSVIGAGAQVTKDVPPFSIVIGCPAKVVKRYSFSAQTWIDSSLVTSDEELNHPDEVAYLAQLRSVSPGVSMPLIAASAHLGNL
jgi:acetyltransferase-like isoleucine patch superfamily enzyme